MLEKKIQIFCFEHVFVVPNILFPVSSYLGGKSASKCFSVFSIFLISPLRKWKYWSIYISHHTVPWKFGDVSITVIFRSHVSIMWRLQLIS